MQIFVRGRQFVRDFSLGFISATSELDQSFVSFIFQTKKTQVENYLTNQNANK